MDSLNTTTQKAAPDLTTTATKGPIRTARLLLRAAENPGDLKACHAWYSDSEVMKFWSRPPHKTLNETILCLDSMETSIENGVRDFVIVHKADNKVIGKCGLYNGTDIGFMLHRSYWRQGIMAEAMEAVLERCWAMGNLDRIVADVDPRNEACIALLIKFGFQKTGFKTNSMKVGEEWVDSVYLALNADAWDESKQISKQGSKHHTNTTSD